MPGTRIVRTLPGTLLNRKKGTSVLCVDVTSSLINLISDGISRRAQSILKIADAVGTAMHR